MFSEGRVLGNKIHKCFTGTKPLQESFRSFHHRFPLFAIEMIYYLAGPHSGPIDTVPKFLKDSFDGVFGAQSPHFTLVYI